MATLVLAAAGAAVGYAVPAIGPSLGWTLGQALGGVLIKAPDKVTNVQGPTLNDLRVFGTEYGQCIPWARGSILTAGQIAWNSDRRPITTTTTTTQSGGGKGGAPGGGGDVVTTTTITTYELDMLIVFTDIIAVGIARIWDNGKLVYNALADASDETLAARGQETLWDSLTFYTGDPAQLPDPDYEAEFGAGNVPAYRHRSSAFIKGLKLGQSGALKNLTFEIVIDGTTAAQGDDWTLKDTYTPSEIDTPSNASAFGNGNIVFCGNNSTHVSSDDAENFAEHSNAPGVLAGITFGNGVFVRVAASGHAGNNEIATYSSDGITWTRDSSGMSGTGYTTTAWRVAFDDDNNQFFAVNSYNAVGALGLVAGRRSLDNGDTWSAVNNLDKNIGWTDVAWGNGWFVVITGNTLNYSGGAITHQIRVTDDSGLLSFTSVAAPAAKPWKAVCHAGSGTFVMVATDGAVARSTDNGANWSSVGSLPATKVWQDVASDGAGIVVAVANDSAATNNAMISFDSGATWSITTMPAAYRMTSVVYDSDIERFVAIGTTSPATNGTVNFLILDIESGTITPTPPTVQDVMETLLERSGLAASQYDMSPLATITRPVRSLPVSQVGPIRATVDLLASCFFFDLTVSDKIYAYPRGGASAATIPYEDLGAGLEEPAAEGLSWRMANDMEMAAYRSITYRNVDNDYQVDTQMTDRLVSTLANTVQNDSIPIGFQPAEAKEIVDVWSNDMVNSQLTATISVLGDYCALEPTDVITVTDRDGNTFRSRITKREDAYPVLKFDIVTEDASIIDAEALTDENYDSSSTVAAASDTQLELMDIPCLRDEDALSGAPYVAGKPEDADGAWTGYTVYQSANGTDYTAVAAQSNDATIGTCSSTLGTWAGGRSFDETNKVTVDIGAGNTLTSSTRSAMLDDLSVNACLIGSELLQFRDANLVSDGVYELRGFLRGARGTEWAISTHAASERFVILSASTLTRPAMPNSQLGVSLDYKGVTFGKSVGSATAEAFTTTGIALKPFSPINARCSRDIATNDATITWQRRTRLSVRMIGSLGISVPLGENNELWEIDVYTDGTFATLARATPLTAASGTVSYTAAQQTADGLTPGNTINIKIYQLSSTVGRGYALTASV